MRLSSTSIEVRLLNPLDVAIAIRYDNVKFRKAKDTCPFAKYVVTEKSCIKPGNIQHCGASHLCNSGSHRLGGNINPGDSIKSYNQDDPPLQQ